MQEKLTDNKKYMDQKLLDYCQELVIVNYMYEQKLLSKEEMLAVKVNVKKSYGF